MGFSNLIGFLKPKEEPEFKPEDERAAHYVHTVEDNELEDSEKKNDFTQTTYPSDSASEHTGADFIVDLDGKAGSKAYNHIFKDPKVAKYWTDIYEETKYENRHLIDPELTWTPKEERKVVLKSDWHACLWAFIMFLALDVDRYNLQNAIAGGLLKDLGSDGKPLSTNVYNLGMTLNLVCFLGAELPSQLVSKAVGADRFLPAQVTLWSVVAICQCVMKNKAGFLVTRCLVGFLEGGFLCEQITWLTYFYTHDEFVKRAAWFYVANPLTQMFSGLLAAAIYSTLEGRGGWSGWRYVFLIEGLVTLFLGLVSFKMPSGPAHTRTWFRPKGWYTDKEEKIMANRIVRDDPYKGTMNNRTGVSLIMVWRAIFDYDIWLLYLSRFLTDTISAPISNYMPLLLKGMGFSTVKTNLLMVPYRFVACVTMVLHGEIASRTRQNGWALLIVPLWVLIPIIAMRWWPGFLIDKWATYGLLFVALCGPPSTPLTVSWNSSNSFSVSRRTVSAALMNMYSQAGGIVGSQIFQASDAPRYPKGLEALVGLGIATCLIVLATRYYYVFRNKYRERKWNSMSVGEQLDYIHNSKDEGNKRLDARFAT